MKFYIFTKGIGDYSTFHTKQSGLVATFRVGLFTFRCTPQSKELHDGIRAVVRHSPTSLYDKILGVVRHESIQGVAQINPSSCTAQINPSSCTAQINPSSCTAQINPSSCTAQINPSSCTAQSTRGVARHALCMVILLTLLRVHPKAVDKAARLALFRWRFFGFQKGYSPIFFLFAHPFFFFLFFFHLIPFLLPFCSSFFFVFARPFFVFGQRCV